MCPSTVTGQVSLVEQELPTEHLSSPPLFRWYLLFYLYFFCVSVLWTIICLLSFDHCICIVSPSNLKLLIMYHFGIFKMFLALYFKSSSDLKISVICKAESDLDTWILLCGKYFLIRYHMTLLTTMHLILPSVLLVEESIFSSPIVPMVKQTSPKVLSEHVTTSANSVECYVTNLYFLSTTSNTGTFLSLVYIVHYCSCLLGIEQIWVFGKKCKNHLPIYEPFMCFLLLEVAAPLWSHHQWLCHFCGMAKWFKII